MFYLLLLKMKQSEIYMNPVYKEKGIIEEKLKEQACLSKVLIWVIMLLGSTIGLIYQGITFFDDELVDLQNAELIHQVFFGIWAIQALIYTPLTLYLYNYFWKTGGVFISIMEQEITISSRKIYAIMYLLLAFCLLKYITNWLIFPLYWFWYISAI